MKYCTILVLTLVIFGCKGPPKPVYTPPPPLTQTMSDTTKTVKEQTSGTKTISEQVLNINRNTRDTSTKIVHTTQEPATKIDATHIYENSTKIDELMESIKVKQSKIDEMIVLLDQHDIQNKHKDTIIESNNKTIADLENQIVELKNDKNKAMNMVLGLVVVGSIITVGVSVFLTIYGVKLFGISLGVAALVTGIISVAFIDQWKNISYLAFVGIAILVILLIVAIVKGFLQVMKDKNRFANAFKENVTLVETMKTYLSADDKKELFGENAKTGLAQAFQSSTTQNLVQQERTEGINH